MKPANFTRFSDNQITDAGNTVDFGIPVLEVQGYTFGRLYAGAIQGSATPASSRKIPMKRVTRSFKPSARTPSATVPSSAGSRTTTTSVANHAQISLPRFSSAHRTHVENSLFGLSPAADAGRVIDFFVRVDF
jgi:hypothetical protein